MSSNMWMFHILTLEIHFTAYVPVYAYPFLRTAHVSLVPDYS